ncbi:hypothetical protein DSECCO2_588190 [anaerobic digester metagenome]
MTARVGMTTASATVARLSPTRTNCPGQRRWSAFWEMALSRMEPVLASTALSTEESAAVTGGELSSPAAAAVTVSPPLAAWARMAGR